MCVIICTQNRICIKFVWARERKIEKKEQSTCIKFESKSENEMYFWSSHKLFVCVHFFFFFFFGCFIYLWILSIDVNFLSLFLFSICVQYAQNETKKNIKEQERIWWQLNTNEVTKNKKKEENYENLKYLYCAWNTLWWCATAHPKSDDTEMRCFWGWWGGDVPKHAATNTANETKHKHTKIKMLAPEIWSTCGFSARALSRVRLFCRSTCTWVLSVSERV